MTLDDIRAMLEDLEPPERIAICHPDRLFDVEAELDRLDADGVRHRIKVKTSRWLDLDQVVVLDVEAVEKALAKPRHPSAYRALDSQPRATQRPWQALRSST